MGWDTFALEWLARAAAGGFVILTAAAVAVWRCREPADRVRVVALALPGALLVPWAALVPGLPRLPVAVLPPEPISVASALVPELAAPPEPARAYRPNAGTAAPRIEKNAEEVVPPSPPTRTAADAVPDTPDTPSPAPPPAAPSWPPSRVALLAYGAINAGLLLWLLLGLLRLALLWHRARPASPEAVALLKEVAGPAADRVHLLASNEIDSPVAFAGWRPVIVLPESLCGPDGRGVLRYALAHEWSHVERGDVWRWYVVAIAQVVFFYQPLFWWLRRQLRLSQDYLADARAADQATEPTDYAEFLVTLARRRLGVPSLALGITDRRSNLTRRVHMLLLSGTPLSRRCRLAWTCGSAAAVLGLLAGLSAVHLTAATPSAAEARPDEPKPPATPPAKGETLNYTGRVTNKDTGKPIKGATVTVRRSLLGDPEQKERNPVLEETRHTTDALGRYSFTIPPEQTAQRYLYIELDVEHPDYASRKGFGYALGMIRKNERHGGRPFFESVEMRPAVPVTGVVKTPDGKPATGVKVQAYSVTDKRQSSALEYGSFADTRTDAEGKFRLPITAPGWAVVWVLPEQYVPTTHVIKDKRGDLGTFTLATGPRLKGTVVDAKGKPLAGVIVNAESRDRNEEITEPVSDNINRSATTNAKGEFEMNPLPPGNYLVKPGEYPSDGSLDRKAVKQAEVPGVFVGTKAVLKAGADPEPIEVRAVPHVAVEAQYLDSKGKPTRGHSAHVFGRIDGVFWFGEARADATGKLVAHVPHGLENTQFDLATNEHGSLRWRKKKGDPLNNTRRVMLGTLTDDVKGIEVIRYTAPILVVKVATKDGAPLTNPAVTATYPKGKARMEGQFILVGGRKSDVLFEKQKDGRFRSEQLLPDQEVTVTGHADGYADRSEKVSLAEGTTRDIEIVLEKAPTKTGEEKK